MGGVLPEGNRQSLAVQTEKCQKASHKKGLFLSQANLRKLRKMIQIVRLHHIIFAFVKTSENL